MIFLALFLRADFFATFSQGFLVGFSLLECSDNILLIASGIYS